MSLPWTREETELARKHYSLPRDEFRQKVGRTKQAARAYLKYISNPSVRKKKCEQKVALRQKNRADIKTWTAQETELARDLIRRREPNEMFLALLGRTKRCAESRLYRVDYPSAVGHEAERTIVPARSYRREKQTVDGTANANSISDGRPSNSNAREKRQWLNDAVVMSP